jgi:MoxR-like ATPase
MPALPTSIGMDQMPMTTVANSGWSPFHTIGGLQPQPDGSFVARPGIFIDAQPGDQKTWQLKDGAIVLDEMNRADLDRAIGELYPLLSRSVQTVYPAGIPGIEKIELHDRFRIIATVNDATLDDVVFPISDGLARRFQRIELPGASEVDVLDYLYAGESTSSRETLADELVSVLFSEAGQLGQLNTVDEAERLSFGVGYFSLLKRWVSEELVLPESFMSLDSRSQALEMLSASLATLKRDELLQRLLKQVRSSF